MRQVLRLHPDSFCAAATRIEVDVTRPSPFKLVLQYFVSGMTNDLRLPPVAAPARGEELWRHTCFEAFVGVSPSKTYYEFNFAPSMQWAAYRFSGYREGMSVASVVDTPHIDAQWTAELYTLRVPLTLQGLPELHGAAAWRLGLSAVIEETNGRKSFWALAHPPGKADFHHFDCFALDLPAA